MNMKTLLVVALLVILTISSAYAAEWQPSEADKKSAESFAAQFLGLISQQKFEESYALLTPGTKQLIPLQGWIDLGKQITSLSGGVAEYFNTRATWYKDPPKAPLPGVYVAFDMDCKYQKAPGCSETLMLHQQPNGSFLVLRYERNLMDRETLKKVMAKEKPQ